MRALQYVALVLVIIGALNWGVVAATGGNDLVSMIFGAGSIVSRVVFALVALAGLASTTLFPLIEGRRRLSASL